jgi:hypothetical protein
VLFYQKFTPADAPPVVAPEAFMALTIIDDETQRPVAGAYEAYQEIIDPATNATARLLLSEGTTSVNPTLFPIPANTIVLVFVWTPEHYQAVLTSYGVAANRTNLIPMNVPRYGNITVLGNPPLAENITLSLDVQHYFRRPVLCIGKSLGIHSVHVTRPMVASFGVPSRYRSKADQCMELLEGRHMNTIETVLLEVQKNPLFTCAADKLDLYVIDRELKRGTEYELLTEQDGQDYGAPDHHFVLRC